MAACVRANARVGWLRARRPAGRPTGHAAQPDDVRRALTMFQSVKEAWFAGTLQRWLIDQRELLVMLRYPNAGGVRDYELHSSLASITERLSAVPAQTSVIVFREPQLPIRGIVDSLLIDQALAAIPEGTEFLLVETVLTTAGSHSWYHNATGERELSRSPLNLRSDPDSSHAMPTLVPNQHCGRVSRGVSAYS